MDSLIITHPSDRANIAKVHVSISQHHLYMFPFSPAWMNNMNTDVSLGFQSMVPNDMHSLIIRFTLRTDHSFVLFLIIQEHYHLLHAHSAAG